MKKIIYTIILILAIITGIVLVTGKIATDKHQKKNVQTKIEEIDKLPIKLEDMGDVEFKLYKIPENVAEYIKTKSEFSSIYKHKKFVVYIKDDKLPFAKEYTTTLEKITNDKKYKKHYNFASRKGTIKIVTMNQRDIRLMQKKKQKLPEGVMTTAEGNAKLDFIKTCGNFCIVNPSKNQMLSLKGNSKKEAAKFEYVLDKYKKW